MLATVGFIEHRFGRRMKGFLAPAYVNKPDGSGNQKLFLLLLQQKAGLKKPKALSVRFLIIKHLKILQLHKNNCERYKP